MARDKSWQIAADLEAAANAVKDADGAIVRCDESTWSEINKIAGIERFAEIAAALQALSDKYQAIADAEPDEPECPSSPTRRHIVDTSMESGPNNCFHCERSMR